MRPWARRSRSWSSAGSVTCPLSTNRGPSSDLRVKDVMTSNPVTTKPDMALSQAAALMLEQHIGSLPVIDSAKLVGIITDRDAVKALAVQVPALRYAAEALW
jgi:predicted transcriptional regulator